MNGEIISYNPGNGAISVALSSSVGAGTYTSWVVNLDGAVGSQGYQGNQGYQGYQGYQGTTGTQGAGGALGYWGSFYDMTDQPLASITAAQPIAIGATAEAVGISITGGNKVTFANAGTYSLTFSIQITNLSSATAKSIFWVKKDGVDYPDSATELDLAPRKSAGVPNRQVITINYVATAEVGTEVQIFWAGDNTGLTVEALPAGTSPVYPAVPSIILTVVQVGNSGLVVSPSEPSSTGVLWLDTDETSDVPVPIGGTAGQVLAKIDAVNYNTQWINQVVAPAGVISQFAGTTAPIGYLLCQGQTLTTTSYPDLFAVLGYTYGGSGTSFKIPDLQNRVPVGRGSGTFASLNSTGGAETVAISIAQMPVHTHTQDSHNHSQNSHSHYAISSANPYYGLAGFGAAWGGLGMFPRIADGSYQINHDTGGATATNNATTATNQNTGGGQAHNNLQPYIVVNYIIKT
jgi:microcystin-dependent protein